MKIKTILGALLVMLVMLVSCKKETSFGSMKCHVDEVTATSVTVTFTAETPSNVSGYFVGVRVSTKDPINDNDPWEDDDNAKLGRASYTFTIDGLDPETKYNVRAFVHAGFGGLTTWGDMGSFTTPKAPVMKLSSKSASYDFMEHTGSFDVTIENPAAGCKLTVSTTDKWITDVQVSGTTVSYKVAENNSRAQRIGKIKLTYGTVSKEFSINQDRSPIPIINGYEYVDLGLSVVWATCNVGASKPEDYGGYYQWAGTTDVTSTSIYLDMSNCPYHTGASYSTGFTKYVPSANSSYWSGTGSPDNKTILDPDDDVASVEWKGSWRMPTDAEWTELRNTSNCSWTWMSINGINGYMVQSKKSGYTDNWIFLPAAGSRVDDILYRVGSEGIYWSSSLYTNYPGGAYDVDFSSDGVYRSDYYRSNGFSVRAVSE